MYEQLSKLYYKEPNKYISEYERRINSYGTIKLPLYIKPFKSNEEFPCFYVNHTELDMLQDQILKQSKIIEFVVDGLPTIAVQQYIRAKLVDELMSTNEIEGVRSTKAEMETVIEIVVRKDSGKKTKAVRHLSLMNSYYNLLSETMTQIENIEDIRKIYDELVKEEIKKNDQLDGKLFRKQPVDVVTQTDKVIHKGVYPEESINSHLTNLISYLNEHNSPMLYKIAISHYYFGYIHPFYDGNGRTSRYISSMYLLKEVDRMTALSLSYSTNQTKQLYYDAFSECNNPLNKGELTFFCEVFFQIIHKSQQDILLELAQKRAKLDYLRNLVQQADIEDDLTNLILYIIGQNYIFGIEGKGMTKQELIDATNKTKYVIDKELKKLTEMALIEFRTRRPVEVILCESLREQLDRFI